MNRDIGIMGIMAEPIPSVKILTAPLFKVHLILERESDEQKNINVLLPCYSHNYPLGLLFLLSTPWHKKKA